VTADARVGLAQAYLADHSQDVQRMRPSEMIKDIITLRGHVGALLRAIQEQRPAACRPMDTSDLNPETGEAFDVDPAVDALAEA
jgi:hypothetical protein